MTVLDEPLASTDRQTLVHLRSRAQDPQRLSALPLDAYRSPALFELEQERIFRHEWLMIGPAAELAAPGSFVRADIAGESIVVVRGDDGTCRALSNVCRHRGMPLVSEPSGTAARLTCPYHLWSYRLDGSLIGAPLMKANEHFDPARCDLPSIRVEEWQGFVFVNLDPDADDLASRLAGISEDLDRYHLDRSITLASVDEEWSANWKLGVENSSESYHHIGPHANSVGPGAPPTGSYIEPGTDHWAAHRTGLMADARNDEWDALVPLTDDDRAAFRCYTIFPSAVILVSGSTTNWLTYLPLEPDRTRLRAGLSFPSAIDRGDDMTHLRELVRESFERVNAEDREIVQQLQRTTGSRLYQPGALSPTEGVLSALYSYLGRALASAAG